MKKTSKLCLLSLLTLSVCLVNGEKDVYAAAPVAPNNMAALEVLYDAEYDASYYSGIEGKSGDALLEGLAALSIQMHRTYNTYDQIRGLNCYSDKDPSKPETNLIDFYSGLSISNKWDGNNNWNREHVWCQSLSGESSENSLYGEKGAGADLHHLRPAIVSLNGSRNNALYGEVDHSYAKYYNETDGVKATSSTGTLYGYLDSSIDSSPATLTKEGIFEPTDNIKGDVARIVMYVYMHYSSDITANADYEYAGTMNIDHIVYDTSSDEQVRFDLLMKWNKLDPVDNFERDRNDYCASVLGLRNPFIDHPEFATMIWNNSYSGEGALKDNNIQDGSNGQNNYLNLVSYGIKISDEETYQIPFESNIESLTFTSSDTSVANVSNSGLITPVGSGKSTITISGENISKTFNLTVNSALKEDDSQESVWTLVKDVSDIKVGDKVIIAAFDYNVAISTEQKSNNRGQAEILKNGDILSAVAENVQIITIENGTKSNTFAFNVDGKYLYAASSASNHLKSQTTLNDNGSWAITIASNGKATMLAQGTNTRNNLRYNSSSSLFSCYGSGQKDVCIYKNVEKATEQPSNPNNPNISEGGNSEPIIPNVSEGGNNEPSSPNVSEDKNSDVSNNNSQEITSTPSENSGTNETPTKGCKGSASTSMIALAALLAVLLKKKK